MELQLIRHILIVEDEPKLASLLRDYLEAARFTTEWVASGTHVLPTVRNRMPDLVLLDLMLPGCDGIEVCRLLRERSQVPIIMVTARVEEVDRLLGLELGADDYICKPFSPREVVARVRAVLRRSQQQEAQTAGRSTSPTLIAGDLRVDPARHQASYKGQNLELTPVEFGLLQALCNPPGRVLSRTQLLNLLYPDGRRVTDRTIDSHVKNLRRKLGKASPDQELVRSIYGVGYKLEL